MNGHPAVSVVIHFVDAERYLAGAVQSVLWQTMRSWELVLVDGGSRDRSPAIAHDFASKFPDRISVVRHPGPDRLGIFESRVAGARKATAPLLAHLDSDDEWHPRFLERQHAIHQRYFTERPGMVYCPMVYWWEDIDRSTESLVQPMPAPGLHQPPHLIPAFVLDGYARTPGNSAIVVSREIILSASELIDVAAQEGMVEDQFLWSLIALRHPVFVNPEPLAWYRQWSGSVCGLGVAAGQQERSRARHLAWLERYLTDEYHGPERNELLRACGNALRKTRG
jgi:glycosyltransferase involved in cell wall biosynthesis